MIEWLKQQYNNLIFELFPILPSYLVRDCYKEFDEKWWKKMSEKRFTLCEGTITGLKSCYEYDGMPLTHLQVLTLLNKLCDENKQLKEENEQLKQQMEE